MKETSSPTFPVAVNFSWKKDNEDRYVGTCLIENCGHVLVGNESSTYIRHMKRRHPADYEKYVDERNAKEVAKKGTKRQLSIEDAMAKSKQMPKYALDDEKQLRLNKDIAILVVDKALPFDTVENPSFRRLIYDADPRWNPLGTEGLHSNIEKLLEDLNGKLKSMLQDNVGFISTQLDLWSDRRQRGHMGIVASMLTEEFEDINCLIAFTQVLGSHTGEKIGEIFQATLADYGITSEAIVR